MEDSFRFGVDFLPNWFKNRLNDMTVDFEYRQGDVCGCRFYNVRTGKEMNFVKGDRICRYWLYKD